MWYVYVLKNANDNLYVGYSSDLKQRLTNHNGGSVAATKHARPWRVLYYETYPSESSARDREKKLKQRGRAWQELKKRINA